MLWNLNVYLNLTLIDLIQTNSCWLCIGLVFLLECLFLDNACAVLRINQEFKCLLVEGSMEKNR